MVGLPFGATTALTLLEEGHAQQYLASAKFILAFITSGLSDVSHQSSNERFFDILMLIVGFFVGTTIVSMMSGSSIQEPAHAIS